MAIIKSIQQHWKPITIFLLLVIAFLSLYPLPKLPEFPGTDKTHHLVAYFLLKEKPPLKNIIGLVIAFSGLIVLTGSPSLEGKYLGVLFVLSGALTWAFGQILAKPISEKVSGWTLTAWIGVLGGPQLIISSYFIEGNTIEHIKSTTMVGWSIVLYLALVMTALGYSIWYYVSVSYTHLTLPTNREV